jgi:glycosyltransferase involved in cell wall biosynthesis
LSAKEDKNDRGWKHETISLERWEGKRKLVFETRAYPTGEPDFCSAGWGDPAILSPSAEAFKPSFLDKFRERAEKILGRLQSKRLQELIELRTQSTKQLFEQVDLFIAPSQFLRDSFLQYGMPPEKIIFSDYGMSDNRFYPNTGPVKRPVRFTYIGTFVEHKGVHVLIEAFNRLPKEGAVLNLYGDLKEFTGYVKRIQDMIAHPGIHLRGRAENQDIPAILENTDAQIVPSIWFENSPITIHEAFLAGVPVITSRYGGMAGLVTHEKNGLLFERGNADELQQCMQRCIDQPDLLERLRPDPASVKSMEEDARWTAEVYRALQQGDPLPLPIDHKDRS